MPTSSDFIISANRNQKVSEVDGFTEDRYKQMGNYLPSTARLVLDAGSGTGRGGVVLKSLRTSVQLVGLDCVPERVEALPKGVYSSGICALSDSLPFGDREIDAIVAGEFLEHVPPAQIDATLCEFFRVLALKGVLVLTTPNPHYIKNKLKNLSVLLDPCHVTQHYPANLKRRLEDIGFSGVKIRGSGRVSKILGPFFPLPFYGSYLLAATKW